MEFKQALLQKMKALKEGGSDLTLDDLIKMVEQEIMLEPYCYSDKQRIKRCLNYAKKLRNGLRPLLGYASDDIEGYQTFTDSAFLVFLDEKDKMDIPNYTEAYRKGAYPILRDFFKGQYPCGLKVKVSDLLNAIKVKKDICIVCEEGQLMFELERMKHLLDFLNYQEEEIVFQYNNKRYQYDDNNSRIITSISQVTKNDSGSYGIICPIRIYNENMMRIEGVSI